MHRFALSLVVLSACAHRSAPSTTGPLTVITDVTLIDGNGGPPVAHRNLTIQGEHIVAIGDDPPPHDAHVVDGHGRFVMPMMVNVHGHLGLLEGTTMSAEHYTRANIERQLVRYRDFGIRAVLSLGTDREQIFALREASREGSLPGARIFTAGFGFGVLNGLPPAEMGMDHVYRPTNTDEARAQVRQLAQLLPDIVKIWVDDFWGKYPKMKPEIYAAIIDEAHKHSLRVAAHIYHADDARALVTLGVDVIAHSIRDSLVDDTLITAMKQHNVTYVPTLSIDEFAFAYIAPPEWLHDPYFERSAEPGVADMVQSKQYIDKLWADPKTRIESEAFKTSLANVLTIYRAGIPVAMGTDSGASPIRPQGFSEHHELANLLQAGLSPLEAITIATKNGARLLGIDGTIEIGKEASFIILARDPTIEISNTETIEAIYYRGQCSLGGRVVLQCPW